LALRLLYQSDMATEPSAAAGREDAVESASAARLRYVSDASPGIERHRNGHGFAYRRADGSAVCDPDTLRRIRGLAIPPAWTRVWICPTATGHLQAVGRDARGRKQYRYHSRWREVRDETKYARLIEFGRVLPRLRRRVERDLARAGLPREKVLATVVRLLETTLIRVGNEEYARQNGSYGLTTLHAKHVKVQGPRLRFEFHGKGGQFHCVDLSDRRLARIVQHCQDLPGHELFQYLDEAGQRQAVDSADVNAYLRDIAGREFTAKDFRTWAGTVLAVASFRLIGAEGQRPRARQVRRAVATVAEQLRNTPAVCRRCYIHPAVVNAFLESNLGPAPISSRRAGVHSTTALRADERAVLRLLEDAARRGRAAAPHRGSRRRGTDRPLSGAA
jgi:DNA topoisomerase-1